MNEFELINRFFAPLAGKEAVGLLDDAAHIMPEADKKLVISKDMLVEGIHFLPDNNPGDIAWKALTVNISDLVAKGAKPRGYLLGLGLPHAPDEVWMTAFASGLKQAQDAYAIHLIGGDTVKSPAQLTISITVIGEADPAAPLRSGARAGDLIYISGSLGGAYSGFQSLTGKIAKNEAAEHFYLRPHAPIDLCPMIGMFASASADISDGLSADLDHILKASGRIGATINVATIPMFSGDSEEDVMNILSWGDDYQVVFTVDPLREHAMLDFHHTNCVTPLTKIGLCDDSNSLDFIYNDQEMIIVQGRGYTHF